MGLNGKIQRILYLFTVFETFFYAGYKLCDYKTIIGMNQWYVYTIYLYIYESILFLVDRLDNSIIVINFEVKRSIIRS